MQLPTWEQASKWLNDELVILAEDLKASTFYPQKIFSDTRSIPQQSSFIAIKGERFDGHNFIDSKLLSSVSAVICSQEHFFDVDSPELRSKAIVVKDTIRAYGKLASGWLAWLRKNGHNPLVSGPKVVAITGSVGKTTTKKMVAAALVAALGKDKVVAPPGSFNNEIGVPKTILQCTAATRCVVLEFGARNVGDIKLLTALTEPDIGICLNAGDSHIGVFGSYENILQEKTEILANGTKLGFCFGDQQDLREAADKKCSNLTFFGEAGQGSGFVSTYRVKQDANNGFLDLKIFGAKQEAQIQTSAVGPGSALAICAAIGVVDLLFDSGLRAAAEALGQTSSEAGRFESISMGNGNSVFINDAYNSNPQSLKAGLNTLATHHADKEKTLVLGTMLELGNASASMHASVAETIQRLANLKKLVTVGEFAGAFGKDAPCVHQHFESLEALLQSSTWNSWVQNGTIDNSELVYLKASNTIGLHKIPACWEKALHTKGSL